MLADDTVRNSEFLFSARSLSLGVIKCKHPLNFEEIARGSYSRELMSADGFAYEETCSNKLLSSLTKLSPNRMSRL